MLKNISATKTLDEQESWRLLNFIQEPVLIVTRSGRIDMANAATRAILGEHLEGRSLVEYTTTSPEAIEAYLRRCAGSGSPIIGSIVLRSAGGPEMRHQVKGALLSRKGRHLDDRIVLRCSATAFREFTRISRQAEDLNRENRRHRHARAVLQEALAQRDLLLKEVQHRVRNHTQMMLGMVSSARREAESDELLDFLEVLKQRLLALGTVQQLMYKSARLEALSSRHLVHDLCNTITEAWPSGAELTVEDCVDVALPNDATVPLALIINELLSNALKHGLNYGPGTATVRLREDQGDLVLTIRDSGRGIATNADGGRASSGMALVRGLCRQIGGSFAVSGEDGTCCTVRFPRVEQAGG